MHTPESKKLYGWHNNRELVIDNGKTIEIDEDKLDLFSYYDKPILDWEPPYKIKPYASLSKIFLDIETAGLDPSIHRIFLIGLMNEKGETLIIKHEDEGILLTGLMQILEAKKPDILCTFNGFHFDLPFIIKRCQINRISHPFYVNTKRKKVFRTAMKFNEPAKYHQIYLNGTSIIDLYHQVLAWDFSSRKLTSHSLKQSTLQMGLRDNARLELAYEQMLECWENRENGGLKTLEEYLEFDLEDTKLLGDRLIPDSYYQKILLDWTLQSLSTSGNATKWNVIMKEAILNYIEGQYQTEEKRSFKGGLTLAIAGLFRNVFKIDVNSLYPSIMLTYGIHSYKDSQAVQLRILKYLYNERLRLKDLASTDIEAGYMQAALKILINSAYGMLGTFGVEFNDYVAAALVTAYGRAILKLIMALVKKYGGETIEGDCLTGDTLVLTDKGIYPIKELAGSNHTILNANQDWVNVPFYDFAPEEIWEVTFKRKHKTITVRSNGKHRYYVAPNRKHWNDGKELVRTEVWDMKPGMMIKNQVPKKPDDRNLDYYRGVEHGIIYGDGSLHCEEMAYHKPFSTYQIELCGEKIELLQYLMMGVITYRTKTKNGAKIRLKYHRSLRLKELPSIDSKLEYLLGFIRGLIATDGNVSGRDGCVDISGDKETVEFIEKISMRCGFQVTRTNLSSKKGKQSIMKNGNVITQTKDNYKIFFENHSICERDLLRSFHLSKFKPSKFNPPWVVQSVVNTGQYEQIYCPRESITHQFTLASGLVSSQTDGLIVTCKPGREREIWKKVNQDLPEGISMAFEWTAKSFFVPPVKSKKGEKTNEGLRKNYIIVYDEDNVKANGKFRKRDKCVLEKTFQPELVKLITFKGKGYASAYYDEIIGDLLDGTYPLDNLIIRRKVRVNEKTLVELGLGKPGESTWYYFALDYVGGKGKKYYRPTQTEEYSPDFYIDMITEQYEQVMRFVP